MLVRRRVRGLVNVVNLSTPAGRRLARLGARSVRRGPDDLWLADGYRLPLPKAPVFTMGSVILFRRRLPDWPEERAAAIPVRLLAHETRHATQYALFGGVLMVPAYLVAAGWSWLRTGDPGSGNVFERAAGLADGGYRERPVRPLSDAAVQLRGYVASRIPREPIREAYSRGARPGTASSGRTNDPVGSNRARSSDSGVGVKRSWS